MVLDTLPQTPDDIQSGNFEAASHDGHTTQEGRQKRNVNYGKSCQHNSGSQIYTVGSANSGLVREKLENAFGRSLPPPLWYAHSNPH